MICGTVYIYFGRIRTIQRSTWRTCSSSTHRPPSWTPTSRATTSARTTSSSPGLPRWLRDTKWAYCFDQWFGSGRIRIILASRIRINDADLKMSTVVGPSKLQPCNLLVKLFHRYLFSVQKQKSSTLFFLFQDIFSRYLESYINIESRYLNDR